MTENPLLDHERRRRRVSLRILWGVAIAAGLVHVAGATLIVWESTSNWGHHGFLVGLGSMLAIFGSHTISFAVNLLLIPPLLATCLTHERAAGAGEMLALTPTPRADLLWAKVRSRVEPLMWQAAAQLALLTPAVLLFEIWMKQDSGKFGAPPLLAVTSGLWTVAGFASSATVSTWAGLKAQRTGSAVALAYFAVLLGSAAAFGLSIGAGYIAAELVMSPRSDDAGGVTGLVTACVTAIALLVASLRLWRHCVAGLDEALTGGD